MNQAAKVKPVSMGWLHRSLLFIAHRTAQIRRELTDWHFILTSSKGCVYATPPQIWWKKTAELPQQPRVSSVKVTDCFLSEVVWHSVPDKLGMMAALCLLEPTRPLTLLPQFCQTSFLWLPAEPGKKSFVLQKNRQIFQICCLGGKKRCSTETCNQHICAHRKRKKQDFLRFAVITDSTMAVGNKRSLWSQPWGAPAATQALKTNKSWKIITKEFGTNK